MLVFLLCPVTDISDSTMVAPIGVKYCMMVHIGPECGGGGSGTSTTSSSSSSSSSGSGSGSGTGSSSSSSSSRSLVQYLQKI